jgi:membrane peptidoglycan carboxypeptidase
MLELGMVTQAQFDEAYNTPVEDYVSYNSPTSGCTYASDAKTFCDYILKSVTDLEMLGNNEAERQANWDRGGYSVYTTVNLDQQDNAQAQLNTHAPANETRFELGAVAVSTEVGTGRILLMTQNKGFDDTGEGDPLTTTAVNFATDRDKGGSSGFQPGSTYKIFTLTDWLINGRGLGEIVNTTPRDFKSFPASCDGGAWVLSRAWKPKNDAGEQGPWTVMRATARSVNVAFVSMAQQLDLCQIRDVAASMGVHRADGGPLQHSPATVLGSNEVAPMTMALAIGAIAGGGIYCGPIAIDKIVAADGTDLGGQQKNCHQAITPDVAAGAAFALQGVMAGGGTGSDSNPFNGYPLIGKTGTTDDSYHTWTLGSSSRSTLAVWVGNIVGKQALRNISLPTGGAAYARHRIFEPIIASLTSMYGGSGFPDPPSSMRSGNTITIPAVGGQDVASVKALLESLGFMVTIGDPVPSSQTTGTVATTDPPPGTPVSKGYSIVIHPSDGSLYVVMPSDLVGKDPTTATNDLVALGFNPGNISYNWVLVANPLEYCTVTGSSPGAGAPTSKQGSVTLDVGSDVAGTPPLGCSP